MSRIVKIATASATILALLGLGLPLAEAGVTAGGGAGCCWTVN